MRTAIKNNVSHTKRIDRAIELLMYYRLSPIEIAYQLNYNSVEEFENNFKERVGFSPEYFKQLNLWDRKKEGRFISRFS